MNVSVLWKWVGGVTAVITLLAALGGGVVWAADTRYLQIVAANESSIQQEIRQLRRQVARIDIKIGNGTATDDDRSWKTYLELDIKQLEAQLGQ